MHISWHELCVKSPRLTIVHITVEVVSTCLTNTPVLLILKFRTGNRRIPRYFGKIRDDLIKVRYGPLVRVTSAKFWMNLEDHSHNVSVEICPPIGENLVYLWTWQEHTCYKSSDKWLLCQQDKNVRIRNLPTTQERKYYQSSPTPTYMHVLNTPIHLGLTLVLTLSGRPSIGDEYIWSSCRRCYMSPRVPPHIRSL